MSETEHGKGVISQTFEKIQNLILDTDMGDTDVLTLCDMLDEFAEATRIDIYKSMRDDNCWGWPANLEPKEGDQNEPEKG
jgi:hypothetical protein